MRTNNNEAYLDPENYEAYYAMKDLIAFLGKLGNNYKKLYEGFLKDFEFHYSDEYEECSGCGSIGVYDCRCTADGTYETDIYDDEAAF